MKFDVIIQGQVGIMEVFLPVQQESDPIYYYKTGQNQKQEFTREIILEQFREYLNSTNSDTQTTQILNFNLLQNDTQYFEQNLPLIVQKLIDLQESNQDDDATQIEDQTFRIPSILKQEFKETWKQENKLGMSFYRKDPKILINYSIYENQGKVQIYQCLDLNTNTTKIFKQICDKREYEMEKQAYMDLKQNQILCEQFLYLDDFQFDDAYQILILNQAECDLLDYMKIQKEIGGGDHMRKEQFVSILKFMVDACIEFENLGIYLQDNKPQNILMQKVYREGVFYQKPVLTDFGSIYRRNNSDNIGYLNMGTRFYFDQKLFEEKCGNYSQRDIIHNELFCMVRSLQVCMHPVLYKNKNYGDKFDQGSIGDFVKEIEKLYDSDLSRIIQKMVDCNYGNRYESFQSLKKDLVVYLEKQQIIPDLFFQNQYQGINELKKLKINAFYTKFFDRLLNNLNNQSIEYFQDMCDYLEKNRLFEAEFIFIDSFEQLKKQNEISIEEDIIIKSKRAFNLRQLGDIQQAKIIYENVLKIENSHFGQDHIKTANTMSNLGIMYYYLGQFQNAQVMQEKALQLKISQFGEEHIESANIISNLGILYTDLGDLEKAKSMYEKALKIQSSHYGKDHIETASTSSNLGIIYYNLGDFQKAKSTYENALKIQNNHYGKDHIQTASTILNIANVNCDLGDFETAKNQYEQVLKIQNFHYGDDHIETARTINNLGLVYSDLGNLEKAKSLYETALKINQNHFGKDHIETVSSINNLGIVYIDLGQLEKAKSMYENALNIQNNHFGEDHIQTAKVIGNLGIVYGDLGQFQEAKSMYEKELQIKYGHYGEDHIENANTIINLGTIYCQLEDFEKAKQMYENALKIQNNHYGKDHIHTASVIGNLGMVYSGLGELKKAKIMHENALKIENSHYGEGHIQTAPTILNLGNVYCNLGEMQKARSMMEGMYGKVKEENAENYQVLYRMENYLGNICRLLGDFEKSKFYIEKSLELVKNKFEESHVFSQEVFHNLGLLEKEVGNRENSLKILTKSVDILTNQNQFQTIEKAQRLFDLASIHNDVGNREKAKEIFEKSLSVYEMNYSNRSVENIQDLKKLEFIYNYLGDKDKAQQYYSLQQQQQILF